MISETSQPTLSIILRSSAGAVSNWEVKVNKCGNEVPLPTY
jgi:hypothetical protein